MELEISINVCDLTETDTFMTSLLIGPVTPNRVIRQGLERGRIDDGAVVLECDEERALAIVDTLRMKYPRLRAYRGKKKI